MTTLTPHITTLQLVRRNAAAGPALSIVSIALLIVGATALVLSITVVTVFAVYRRRVRRRKLAAKVESEHVEARPSHSTADGQMTPAMRLAYSTRMGAGAGAADMERGSQPVSILRNSGYAPSDSRPSFSSSSRQMIATIGPMPPSASAMTMGSIAGSEYTQASGSRTPPRMPPMPADGPLRIEMARQQQLQRQQHHQRTRSSAPSSRSASIKSTKKPAHARDTSKSRSTISSALLESLGELPQVPTTASVKRAPSNPAAVLRTTSSEGHGHYRTYSPPRMPASLSERKISKPMLHLGTDGERGSKRHAEQTPNDLDNTLMEQASWLASALDSAFNTTNDSFSSPPRRAPPAPRPSTAATSSSADQSQTQRVIVPAPKHSSPKKHETPTTGGASRVTVDYYTPYQRRTLHRDSDDEPVEMIATDAAVRAASIDVPRPSMESTMNAAALFASIEPALRSTPANTDSSFDRSSTNPSANATLAFSSTLTPDVSRDESGNDTNNTSLSEGGAEAKLPATSRTMPTLTLPTELMRECQEALSDTSSNPASPMLLGKGSNADDSSPKLKSVASFGPTLTTSKSGFAASLRAKFTLNRSRSTLAMSAGGSASSSPRLRATTPTSPPMPSPLSPRLPVISGLSPAMSNLSALEGTPNSFGPPTETWNLSTEDIDVPSFVPSSRNATPIGGRSETQGLGLQTNELLSTTMSTSNVADDIEAPLRFVKTSTRPAHAKQASVSLERMNSASSYGSNRPYEQRATATGMWSNKLGLPSISYDVEDGAPLSPAMEELHSTATSPRFADAENESPNAPPMRFFGGVGPSSLGHASTGHSVGHSMSAGNMLEEQRWMLNRQVGSRQRDSMASSYCDTINSDVTGYSDQTGGGAGNGEDAQMQRAKLLQSVQKRQEARQLERKVSAKRGFTSHSASLSIDVGQGPPRVEVAPQTKDANRLDINVDAPFMAGTHGMMTPPMTPYESTVPLPNDGGGVETVTSVDSGMVPAHARVRPSPTLDQRLSKLRPLSLAVTHAQNGGQTNTTTNPYGSHYNAGRRNSNSSHKSAIQMPPPSIQRPSHRAHTSRQSGVGHDVSPSSSFASAHTASSAHSQRVTAGSATGVALKRISRAGSSTGSAVAGWQGPMGAVHGPGLSTTMSSVSSVVATTALPVLLTDDASPPRITVQAMQRRPSLVPYNNDQLTIDARAPSPSRLSGSSYNSHTSILNRFPALHPVAGAAAASATSH